MLQGVIDHVIYESVKKHKNSGSAIGYTFDLDIKGAISYGGVAEGVLDLQLKGNSTPQIALLNKNNTHTVLSDLKGSVDVKGFVSILGVKLDVDEHFDF